MRVRVIEDDEELAETIAAGLRQTDDISGYRAPFLGSEQICPAVEQHPREMPVALAVVVGVVVGLIGSPQNVARVGDSRSSRGRPWRSI